MPKMFRRGQFTISLSYDKVNNKCHVGWYDDQIQDMVYSPIPPKRVIDTLAAHKDKLVHNEESHEYLLPGNTLVPGLQGMLRIPDRVYQMMTSRPQEEQIRKKNDKRIF